MSESYADGPEEAYPKGPEGPLYGPELGVMEAVGLGWELLKSNFWTLWVVSFLAVLIQGFSGPGVIVVGPPLLAGLYYVLAQQADGREVRVGMLFHGFSYRFKPSFIAHLVPYCVGFGAMLLWVPIHLAVIFGAMGLGAAGGDEETMAISMALAIALDVGAYLVLLLGSMVVWLFFMFAGCAVWDRPDSGWEAAKESARLVRAKLGSVIGLCLLFVLIGVAAAIVGYLACCIGIWFTTPIVFLWYAATVLYLYRSWTGREGGWAVEADGPPAGGAPEAGRRAPPGGGERPRIPPPAGPNHGAGPAGTESR